MPMPMVTQEKPAGAEQPLFVDFVNTLHWYEGMPIELIGNLADLGAWLREYGLPAPDLDAAVPTLHALRAHARAATEALVGGRPPAGDDLAAIEAALGAPAVRVVLVSDADSRPQLGFDVDTPAGTLAAFRIALSFANFLEAGDSTRLKLCANPGCGFAFLDTSTNRTRRWCYMRYCGNRLKARAFRRRRQSSASVAT